MADRTSAGLFAEIFDHLARQGWEMPGSGQRIVGRDDFAAWLFELSQRYDFSTCQMEADDALVALGLMTSPHDPTCCAYVKKHSVLGGNPGPCTCDRPGRDRE